jgi:ArsR family transcriptional regulator
LDEREALKILKALSDETRLNIIKSLLDGEKCVCEILLYVKRKQPTVSLQLEKLKNQGILESRREGKKVYYKIKNDRVYDILKVLNIKR